MGTILATGLGKGAYSVVAAEKAVMQAKDKLGGGRVDISLVYSSSDYDYQAVVDTVRAATGNAPLIGCSSSGEFTEENVEQGSVAVGLIASDDIKFATAIADGVKEDPERAVRTVANKLPLEMGNCPHLSAIFFIDGLAGVGEEMTVLASTVFNQTFGKNVKLAGGAAGDDLKFKETFVFSDDSISTDAVSVCLFASKKPLYTGVQHGHTPVSELLRTTRAEGCVLHEIDGRPAWDVWKERTAKAASKIGVDVGAIEGVDIGAHLIRFELGLPNVDGQYKIRVPLGKNEDGSLNFGCAIPEGISFRIMEGNKENQIVSARVAAEIAKENSGDSEIAGAIVFDCACRHLILGDEFYRGVDQFKELLGDVPVLGWETYGEICMEPGQFSGFHNTTSVVMIIPK
ncbi:MAG: FIST N-terminal domain-containing protein [Euryarchaeota archaeon]|nr:FIST N-terminal domain-containing protein [Euryarchaeota archaeon]